MARYSGPTDLFINGEWVKSQDGRTFEDVSPVTGETWAEVQRAGAADVDRAVRAAHEAFATWRRTPPQVREDFLLRAAEKIRERRDELVEVLVYEAGQTVRKAENEVEGASQFCRAAAGEARRINGEVVPSVYGKTVMVLQQPVGVVGAIKPWNVPISLSMSTMALALAAGNTVVLKPSEETPVSGLKLAEVLTEAGCPPGVVNVVPGFGEDAGDALVVHPLVKMISFTGSAAVGKIIARRAVDQMKRFTLETSGKDALIVCRDADLDYAARCATFGAFNHNGQICMGTKRVLVEQEVYEPFLERFVERVRGLSCGDPRSPQTFVGPMINARERDKIHRQVEDARAKGARILTGGRYDGLVYEPTLITDVRPDMDVYVGESFGPLTVIIPVKDVVEAVEIWNQADFGLSGAIITDDLEKILYVIEHAECGQLNVNDQTVLREPMTPFGGVKNSGMGREGCGRSILDFTETKVVTLQAGQRNFPL